MAARLTKRMRSRIVGVALATVLLTACGGPGVLTPRSTGTVSGHVMSRVCGGAYPLQETQPACKVRPMAGVKLTFHLSGTSTTSAATSDSSGAYRIDLQPGTYTVEVGGVGRYTRTSGPRQVTVAPGQAVTADFTLAIELL